MLVIRAEQMNAFRLQLTADLAKRLLARLAEIYPDQPAAALVDTAIAGARAYGITAEDHIFQYLEFVLHYGDPRDTKWACEILQQPDLSAEEKLRLLDGCVLFGMGRASA